MAARRAGANPTGTARKAGTARLTVAIGRLWLWCAGWRLEGELPPVQKAVVIAAPHTTNWDLPFMLAVSWVLGVRPSWLGKRELFYWPAGWLMRRLGGVPIDRNVRANVVEQVVRRFADSERLFLVVPPSGTRSRAEHWKSGFYFMARDARVPIVCAYLDYGRKCGGIGPTIVPTENVAADMERIRAAYLGVSGRYPHLETPVRLREETGAAPRAAGSAR